MSSSPASTDLVIWRSIRRRVSVSFRLDDYFCSEGWCDLFQRHGQVKLDSTSHKKTRNSLLRDLFPAFPPSFNWDVWISSDLWVTETTRGRLTCLYTKQFVRYCWKWFLVNLLIIHLVTHRLSGSERRDEDTYYNRHHLGKEAWSTRGTVTKTLSPTRLPLNPKKNQHTLPVDAKAQNGGVAVLKAVVNTYWNIATNAD